MSAEVSKALRIVWVYPDLLSTYGDYGNALILARRAQQRGIAAEVIPARSDQLVPTDGDIYLLGGGEDRPQVLAARRLRADCALRLAAEAGAVIFGVCARSLERSPASGTATAPTARITIASSAPTCTGPCWSGIRRSPTTC